MVQIYQLVMTHFYLYFVTEGIPTYTKYINLYQLTLTLLHSTTFLTFSQLSRSTSDDHLLYSINRIFFHNNTRVHSAMSWLNLQMKVLHKFKMSHPLSCALDWLKLTSLLGNYTCLTHYKPTWRNHKLISI